MTRNRWIVVLVVGALAVAGVFGLVVYGTARAANLTLDLNGKGVYALRNLGRGPVGGFNNEDLAEALGISVDELNAAYEAATEAALAQAVENGLITQAQADELRERGSAFPFGGRWEGFLSQNGIDYEAFLADALGISVEELQAAYAETFNARIDQAVADGRITEEQADFLKGRYALYNNEGFQSAMRSAFENAVNQAVSDGVITQAQAEAILESSEGLGFPGLKGFGGLGDFGRGHRGGRHGWWGEPGEQTAPEAPTETETPSSDA